MVNSVSVFTLFGFIHLKNHPMDGAPVAVGALHLNLWCGTTIHQKHFYSRQLPSRHHKNFFLKINKIETLWLFVHTKTLGHGLYMEFQDNPTASGCKYHIFPTMTSSLTQSFMVGFIMGLIIWGN